MAEEIAVAETPAKEEAAVEQVQVAAPAKQKKKAVVATGNYIQDVAAKVENLTKAKALSSAQDLIDTIDSNFFELGGVLSLIKNNQWYDGLDSAGEPFKNFADYVKETFDFKVRKADYLIEIYESLVTKSIPWDKVKDLKWTKLSILAKLLTPENVDEWVAKAMPLTVAQLQMILKGDAGEGDGAGSGKTTSDIVVKKFSLHSDQDKSVTEALQKAKVTLNTDADNVALEGICIGYLGGTTALPSDLVTSLKELGVEASVALFNEAFPDQPLTLDVTEEAAS